MPDIPLLIGHRGASANAPENTLAAFELAWVEGADGVEADFRLTGDGHIVCMHDESTGRTAVIDSVVASASLEQLRRLDVGGWKDPRFAGSVIPTLPEVLAALPAGKKLFLELKTGPEIIAPLSRALAGSGVNHDQVVILSFSAQLIAEVKRSLPRYKACLLTEHRWPSAGVIETLRTIRADGLASDVQAMGDGQIVGCLHQDGKEIHVWTVDEAEDARCLRTLGVDSIMTNRPGWLRAELAKDEA